MPFLHLLSQLANCRSRVSQHHFVHPMFSLIYLINVDFVLSVFFLHVASLEPNIWGLVRDHRCIFFGLSPKVSVDLCFVWFSSLSFPFVCCTEGRIIFEFRSKPWEVRCWVNQLNWLCVNVGPLACLVSWFVLAVLCCFSYNSSGIVEEFRLFLFKKL